MKNLKFYLTISVLSLSLTGLASERRPHTAADLDALFEKHQVARKNKEKFESYKDALERKKQVEERRKISLPLARLKNLAQGGSLSYEEMHRLQHQLKEELQTFVQKQQEVNKKDVPGTKKDQSSGTDLLSFEDLVGF